ncbi:Glycopeptide antibiotics resistance protein [Clostridium acidisoli DSM 12555]|uniref:Glycopeptide antibiotics resistance protein n=1 Tax=Clostridium acidisoli DSM 12555 TaxID=1121291 RepID=A0A1W1XYR2_9CLOT|nr:VanZ family protein [Clostridium acidisoli]SMC29056.1 Glycopeptide antibiotics resistance protein [Clostridium acidisoli DSM 12555]
MNPIMSLVMLIISFFLVTLLNTIISKNIKHLKREIPWHHYLFGYFFIFYLMITLILVGFPSLSQWKFCLSINKPIFNPHINLVPFKDGFDITNILNIVLFIPFGFLLPTLWKKYRNLKLTFCYGLFFTVFIEVSQLFTTSRTTDIDDIIMNIIGAICGWIIFNIVKNIFSKFANKTVIDICSSDNLAIKLEPYLYILIAIVCAFFQ